MKVTQVFVYSHSNMGWKNIVIKAFLHSYICQEYINTKMYQLMLFCYKITTKKNKENGHKTKSKISNFEFTAKNVKLHLVAR